MTFINGAVERPHTVIVVVVLCVIFGLLSIQSIPVQLKPAVDKPEIEISMVFRGASPSEVEDQITTPIEEQMDSVSGIRRVTSQSADGRSTITLEFDWGVNKDTALIDVINKLNQVSDLPEDADEPSVVSVSSDEQEPIMWLVMETTSKTPNELFEVAEDIIDPQFRRVLGVSDLFVFGGEEREMQIKLSPSALVSRRISIQQLIRALLRENLNVRGGFLDEGKRRYNVRTVGQFSSPDDVGDVIVERTGDGAVYLRELATVEPGYKKQLSQVRTNGKPTVVFGVKRKSGSNMVEVCQGIVAKAEQLNTEFADKGVDIHLGVVYNAEHYINESIDRAWINLMLGGLLASIVLLVFLKSLRSLMVVAVTIPVCLITVFIFINALGRSLNIISLAGLAFSSGLVVDNAIVVIENIYRHLAMGKKAMVAAKDAAAEVWGAILISTLTTLAVFVPVVFIQEEAGQLFKDIAIAICLSVGLSLVAALSVIPMMASHLLSGKVLSARSGFFDRLVDLLTLTWLARLAGRLYNSIIEALVGRSPLKIIGKIVVITVVVLLFLASLKLLPDAEYLPNGNRNLILVFAQPIVGNNIEKSVISIRPLEVMLKQDERIERFFTVMGTRFNAVGFIVKPEYASERQMKAFVGELFAKTRGICGFESLFPMQASIFRDPGKQIEIDIIGPSLDKLAETSARMQGMLFGTKGVQFVRSSYQAGSPEVQIVLDRKRCAALGMRVSDAADFIEGLVAGKHVGVYDDDGEQIDLTLYAGDGLVETRQALANSYLISPNGRQIRLGTIADLITTTAPSRINHVEKERSVTLTVNLTPAESLEEAIATIERTVLAPTRAILPNQYSLRLAGTADKLDTTLEALTGSFGLAVLIVYLLMAALFRSWIYPLIILVTIPMAMSGAFLGITVAHRLSGGLVGFDVIAMLGLVILTGIVVNNAILIVHQALNFRAAGRDPDDALILSCESRLRPITMSVVTSVLGMSPLAIGSGAGTELYRGLGAVLLGGLIVSTVFTLFMVPALLSLVQDIQYGLGRLFKRRITE